MDPKAARRRIVNALGNQTDAARVFNVSQGNISDWLDRHPNGIARVIEAALASLGDEELEKALTEAGERNKRRD